MSSIHSTCIDFRSRQAFTSCPAPTSRRQAQRTRCRAIGVELLAVAPARDIAASASAVCGSVALVKTLEYLAAEGFVERPPLLNAHEVQKLSRKLVHILAGPGLILTWPLFSSSPDAAFFAAVPATLNALRLFLVGSGLLQQPGLVSAVSRSNDRSELLQGPFFYVLVLIAVTLLGWRSSVTGVMVVAMMCGGDGLADIVGRRLGSAKLPWNEGKSWAGSGAMFAGGLGLGYGLLAYLHMFGCITTVASSWFPMLACTAAVCTVVESLPVNIMVDDNLSVPGAAAVVGLCFPTMAYALSL